jgi:hypothetical protein
MRILSCHGRQGREWKFKRKSTRWKRVNKSDAHEWRQPRKLSDLL